MANDKRGSVPHKVLTDRGVHLEQANQRQQGSNIHTGKMADGGEGIRIQIGSRCPSCGKRVRGLNHVNGDHHRGIVKKHTR